MYVRNQNFAIYLILAVIVGFGVSFLFGGLSVQSDLAGGDISKASRYYNQKEDPSFTVIEERLRNDGEFLNRTKGAMDLLQNRMAVLSELTEKTMEVCAGIPEFQSLMTDLQSMNARAFNTAQALENAGKGLDRVADGKKAPEYELYSNQAYIGFSKVESQMDLGEKFCKIASSFLEGKDEGQYQQIAQLLAVWEVYCFQDSRMFADNKDRREPQTPPDTIPLHGTGLPSVKGPHGLGGLLGGRVLDEYINTIVADTKTSGNDTKRDTGRRVVNIPLIPGGGSYNLEIGSRRGGAISAIDLLDAFPAIECFAGTPGLPNASQIESQTLNKAIVLQKKIEDN